MKKQPSLDKVIKFLTPLYKKGKPFIIKEDDYRWIREIQTYYYPILEDPHQVMQFRGEPVYFDTLKTKTKPMKPVCRGCNKSAGKIKFYIIADNLEEPKPYHKKCIDDLHLKVLMNLSGIK